MKDVTYYSHTQPRQLFLDTLCDFWKSMGDKQFWADTKKASISLSALIEDYFHVDHEGRLEDDATSLEAAIDEYHRREAYLLLAPTNTDTRE